MAPALRESAGGGCRPGLEGRGRAGQFVEVAGEDVVQDLHNGQVEGGSAHGRFLLVPGPGSGPSPDHPWGSAARWQKHERLVGLTGRSCQWGCGGAFK